MSKKEKKSKKSDKKCKSKKKEDSNKLGEGYDKYLPLLPTYWFDGTFAAEVVKAKKKAEKESRKEKGKDKENGQSTALVPTSHPVLDIFNATPISSDFHEQRLSSFNGRRNKQLSLTPGAGEKLWCMPSLHADIPEVLLLLIKILFAVLV